MIKIKKDMLKKATFKIKIDVKGSPRCEECANERRERILNYLKHD